MGGRTTVRSRAALALVLACCWSPFAIGVADPPATAGPERGGAVAPDEAARATTPVRSTSPRTTTGAVEAFATYLTWALASPAAAERPHAVAEAIGGRLPADEAAMLEGFDRSADPDLVPSDGGYRVRARSGSARSPEAVVIEVVAPLTWSGGATWLLAAGVVTWSGSWVPTSLRPVPSVPPVGRDGLPGGAGWSPFSDADRPVLEPVDSWPSVPEDPPGTAPVEAVEEPRDARAAAARRLLVVGDSISQGSSGDFTWRYRLWRKLRLTAPGEVRFVGTTNGLFDLETESFESPYYARPYDGAAHAARWRALLSTGAEEEVGEHVAATRADTLVVMLGINDLLAGATPEELEPLYRALVLDARAAAPGIDVVLCEVLSRHSFWTGFEEQAAESEAVAGILRDLAAELSTRTERVVVAPTRAGWEPRRHTYDGTHPNATGETLIAQRVSVALSRLGLGTRRPDVFERTRWAVAPAAPLVTTDVGEATVTWSRASTGATAMYVEYARARGRFTRLPLYVDGTDSWTLSPLAGGRRYRFRTVPVKGFMTGLPGPATERRVPAG